MKYMLIYNSEEQKWHCSKCDASYYPEEIQRVWDYSLNPVPQEMQNFDLCAINFIPCHCMDCGAIWRDWNIGD